MHPDYTLPRPRPHASLIPKRLKEEAAKRIQKTLRENLELRWCRSMLSRLRLPPGCEGDAAMPAVSSSRLGS
jgi:hypothetical protein